MGSPDLAHAALPNQRSNFIGAKATAGADEHVGGIPRQDALLSRRERTIEVKDDSKGPSKAADAPKLIH